MPKNRMSDLRDHLFETLELLKEKDESMDLDRAKAIVGVAQAIINSATVEVKYLNAIGAEVRSSLFPAPEERPALPEKGLSTGKTLGVNGRTVAVRPIEVKR